MKNLWDMHCHVVPHVDDGSHSMKTSLEMLKKDCSEGITNIIVTPHYRRGMFETNRDTVKHNFLVMYQKAVETMPDLKLYLGCEFHADPLMVQMMIQDERYRMNGTRYVLVEFSESDSEKYIKETCANVINAGLYPIIAHVERYTVMRKDRKLIEELRANGVMIQVNADSVLGIDGFFYKWFCRGLLQRDEVDFIGSDSHDMKNRISNQKACAVFVRRKYGKEQFRRIFRINPSNVIANIKKDDD